ncbi:catalase [Paenalkalicoccus suaedae]|uniref:Catalase n=1 Tax=Paenalkalicoccus suaedae TaxID=2592382 RepID=A0A859FB24_9BACI|nr:catalase [Paenalkalicoccus suaedae]QKS70150.1 catalase [Paenalkalicoccus suaedae]
MSKKLTTNQGVPIRDNQNSRTAGENGPILLEDYQLLEKIAHFDREKVPERVVHARGFGAHGVFKVKNSMKRYTKAKFLQEEGQETPIFTRFSTVIHGHHSPETLRDPRGFSVKFYTEEGNYDFVGNNLPVFFIRDTMKFPDVIHSLKPDPRTNVQDGNRYWDFMSLTPESTNMLLHLFSDEGIPRSYRTMRGSSVHAFKWVNAHGNYVYVKYRWVPKLGIQSLSAEEAEEIQGKDFNHASVDTFNAIEEGDFPEWDLYVQFLQPEDLDEYDFNPLDATKEWFEDDFPYHHVGTMTLNKNVENFFAETESVGFNPGVLVPGIEPSEDKMLQGRLFSYSDTQRYRIGTNYLQLPINCPYAQVANNQRDGAMPYAQQKSTINYEPNSHEGEPEEDPSQLEHQAPVHGVTGRQPIEKKNDFGHAGQVWNTFTDEYKESLVKNLTDELGAIDEKIAMRQLCNFYRASEELGKRVSDNLNIDIESYLQSMHNN